jgi:hypothetical protein
MRLLLAAAIVAGTVQGARADETFESKGGQRIRDVADLAWALTATCEAGDDVQQRQCRLVRDARQKQLAGTTLLVDAKPAAFEVGAWSPAKKSIALSLSACIDCGGVAVAGKTYFLTGANAQPVSDGARVKTAARLLDTTRTFPDEATAKAWLKVVGAARVQLLVKVPDKGARWQVGGKEGLALDIIGYRVYGACEGTVIVASPPSGNVEPDKTACAKADGSADFQMEGEPGELTSRQVNDTLAPVVAAARGCFARDKIAGTARLELTIAADGSVAKYAQKGDFQNTPTGRCIDDAMRKVRFPKASSRANMVYPIQLK